ncbi:DUF559 domain-containing protein [Mycobacterium sp. 236(2023)]|uniref:DUF559 domain-containing protein n=1 Tax=Mycobacterium sp. 236(2023) TaxID=3038163 RepID=UPI00241580AB|nr:DUF559 domain-containing protein [Mycobacterium sp. 236(2023)]MDG4665145.1 DUF559 domain-containing protein [Mycobacterium sp. 236(2023)]
MREIVVASEALTAGELTRQDLRRRFVKVHHNVYAPVGLTLTAQDRAYAAWLWSRRSATLAGLSAAAMHGARWIPPDAPAELTRVRCGAAQGIVVHREKLLDDEVCLVQSIDCTTAARTALDMGRRIPGDEAIIRIDALLNATRCPIAEVSKVLARHPGARGIRRLREVLELVDGGAESPQETRVRLLLVRSGAPKPQTQIPVRNAAGRVIRRIDMGWPAYRVGVEYDGEQHWTDSANHADDITRLEFLAERGWTIVRVSARHLRREPDNIWRRVDRALRLRGWPGP